MGRAWPGVLFPCTVLAGAARCGSLEVNVGWFRHIVEEALRVLQLVGAFTTAVGLCGRAELRRSLPLAAERGMAA
jgi:hypothetical protein